MRGASPATLYWSHATRGMSTATDDSADATARLSRATSEPSDADPCGNIAVLFAKTNAECTERMEDEEETLRVRCSSQRGGTWRLA